MAELDYRFIADSLNETFNEYSVGVIAKYYSITSAISELHGSNNIYLFDAQRDGNQVIASKKPFASISIGKGEFTFYKQPNLPTDEDLGLVMREVYELIDEVYPKNYWICTRD